MIWKLTTLALADIQDDEKLLYNVIFQPDADYQIDKDDICDEDIHLFATIRKFLSDNIENENDQVYNSILKGNHYL